MKVEFILNSTVKGYQGLTGWKNQSMEWEDFIEYLRNPKVQDITIEEVKEILKYKDLDIKTLDKTEKQLRTEKINLLNSYKDSGAFDPVVLTGNRRIEKNIKYRTMLILDIDDCNKNIWETVKHLGKYEYILHTSFSHTPENPRLRIIFPLSKNIKSKEEYKEIVKGFMFLNKIDSDVCSNKLNQPMFLPNKTKDGEYIFKHNKGEIINPYDFISKEESRDDLKVQKMISGLESPYEMEDASIIKQFCLKYDIHETIEKWLNDVYINRTGEMYTYCSSSGINGLKVYSDKDKNDFVFAYSFHGTDPLNDGHCHNSFDLLKVHLFDGNIEKTKQKVKEILGYKEKKEPEKIVNMKDYMLNHFKNEINKYKNLPVNSTGFKELDEKLDGGIRPGLYVLGAISSLGKTTFIHQIADTIAKSGTNVLFFSLEQSVFELSSKSISRNTYNLDKTSGLASNQIMKGEQSFFLDSAIEEYIKYSDKINIIEGNFNTTVKSIRENIETHIKKERDNPFVVVDYLQIIPSMDNKLSDKQKIDMNVSELKRISRDFNIPLFIISSLNRDSYLCPISFTSFKESGGIEYTADVIFGLQYARIQEIADLKKDTEKRFQLKMESKQNPRKLQLSCIKNRNGEQHYDINLDFIPKYSYFEESKNINELFDK